MKNARRPGCTIWLRLTLNMNILIILFNYSWYSYSRFSNFSKECSLFFVIFSTIILSWKYWINWINWFFIFLCYAVRIWCLWFSWKGPLEKFLSRTVHWKILSTTCWYWFSRVSYNYFFLFFLFALNNSFISKSKFNIILLRFLNSIW